MGVTISKSVNKEIVRQGDLVTFTITLNNPLTESKEVKIDDYSIFPIIRVDNSNLSISGNHVTGNLTLTPNQTIIITIVAQVPTTLPPNTYTTFASRTQVDSNVPIYGTELSIQVIKKKEKKRKPGNRNRNRNRK